MERDIAKFVSNARVKKGPNKGRHLSEGSRTIHRKNLNIYLQWLRSEGFEDWYDLRPSDIGTYLTYREEENGSRGKDVALHVASLKRFYEYLEQDFPDRRNPVKIHTDATTYATGRTARDEEGFDTGVADQEFQLLLENVGKRHAERDRLIINFLGRLGLRRSEVAEVKVEDVNLQTQRIDVPGTKTAPRPIKFWTELKPAIRRWIEGGQRESYQHAYESAYLFLSERGKSLGGAGINKIVRKAAERAGIQEVMYVDASGHNRYRITAHQLRHYFGHKMFRNDEMSLKALSEYMGHSSVDITADSTGT